MNLPSFLDRRFYFFVKEWDDICNLGRNECFEFFSLWILLHLPEDSSCRRYSFSREDNFLLNSENYATKIFRLFFVLECQGGWVRLNTTIYSYKMRGMRMDKSGYNLPYWYFMSMSAKNLVDLRCNGGFYTGVISHWHYQWMSKGSERWKNRKGDPDLGWSIMKT